MYDYTYNTYILRNLEREEEKWIEAEQEKLTKSMRDDEKRS